MNTPLIFNSKLVEDPVAYRQMLLDNSAWIMEPWCGFSPERKAKWAEYRAILEALPQQEGWPKNPAWPLAPGHTDWLPGEELTIWPEPI